MVVNDIEPVARIKLVGTLAIILLAAGAGIAQSGDNAAAASSVFGAKCASCHGATLDGQGAPALKSNAFRTKWGDDVDALADFITKTMPPGAPRPLDPAAAKDLARYILSRNKEESTDLGTNAPVLFTPVDDVSRQYELGLKRYAARLTPVTDEMLRASAGNDWVVWRGSTDALGYSTLNQIDRSNVGKLKLVWSKSLGIGTNGIAPLAHDGVLFVHGGRQIAAFDGRNGNTIWRRADVSPARGLTQPRGLALYADKLYAATVNNHLLAIEARTGKLVWERVIGDKGSLTAAPLAANGKIFQGAATCAVTGARCYMVALDANSGEEIWRFDTVPADGAPGSKSWNGAPASQRGGAGVWSAASYDYVNDRVIFGTGNSYAVRTMLSKDPKRPAAALFANTTLSLDAKTGALAWYFQHGPGDVWDEDWAYERMIVKNPRGGDKPVVMTMGKLGILDVVDMKTGKYLWSYDYGIQNLVSSTNPATGLRKFDAAKIPRESDVTSLCPYAGGVRNWPSTSYDPEKAVLFIAALDACMETMIDDTAIGGSVWKVKPRDGSGNNYGHITAVDLYTGKKLWDNVHRSPEAAAVLATAGGLVFEGTRDRWFRALDSGTGKTLWETRLADTPNSFPITYKAGGKQFVAIITGGGTYFDGFVSHLTPEIEASTGNPTIFVFALEGDVPDTSK